MGTDVAPADFVNAVRERQPSFLGMSALLTMTQTPVATLHPAIRMLSDEHIKAIHNASLDILSQTGIVARSVMSGE